MSRKRRKKYVEITQCERCGVRWCSEAKQRECARLDFLAMADGDRYECPDMVMGYWERMDAA